jgi:poly(3-hydroxybutyrate) depolymerase
VAILGIIVATVLALAACSPSVNARPVADARSSVPHPNAYERSGRVGAVAVKLPSAAFPGPYPLVVALHSLYHSGAETEEGLDSLAATAGFAVAYPNGISESWNAGSCCGVASATRVDDVDWLRSLISDLEQRYPIDPRRVILVGLSNGGMMALRYACEHADEIAGVAVVAASLEVSDCHPSSPLDVVAVHGLLDQHVPYNGTAWSEPLQTPIASGPASLAPFRAVDGCPVPSQPDDSTPTGPDGLPATLPPAASRAQGVRAPVVPAGPTASAGTAPGATAPGATAPAGTAPAGTAATAAATTYTAVRKEATCAGSASVIEYLLPHADHGWPPTTGPAAFDTGAVIWRTLASARSAHAGPLI